MKGRDPKPIDERALIFPSARKRVVEESNLRLLVFSEALNRLS